MCFCINGACSDTCNAHECDDHDFGIEPFMDELIEEAVSE